MPKNGQYKISIENRITTLEANYIELKDKIEEVVNNHLKHLADNVDKIQWLLITNLIAVIFLLLQKYIAR